MPGRLGPRFALETGFLILLAVLAGFADLSWPAIVLVMGAAWALVTIHEVACWKESARLPAPVPRSHAAWAPEPVAEPIDDITRVIRLGEPGPQQAQLDLEADLRPGPAPEPFPQPRHVRVLPRDAEPADDAGAEG